MITTIQQWLFYTTGIFAHLNFAKIFKKFLSLQIQLSSYIFIPAKLPLTSSALSTNSNMFCFVFLKMGLGKYQIWYFCHIHRLNSELQLKYWVSWCAYIYFHHKDEV